MAIALRTNLETVSNGAVNYKNPECGLSVEKGTMKD
jgi:hypothetical protein